MGLAQRLKKLERIVERKMPRIAEDSEEELSDEEEADRIGRYHWEGAMRGFTTCIDDEWSEAVAAARAAGHTEYQVGLRPYAMQIWCASGQPFNYPHF